MDKEEKKKRITNFLMYFSGHCGSAKLNQALGIKDNLQNSKTHKILEEMVEEGKLEQCHSKGFRITAEYLQGFLNMMK